MNTTTQSQIDQTTPGTAIPGVNAARDAVAPLAGKARAFAKERPAATAALLGVVGLALFNTLRGR